MSTIQRIRKTLDVLDGLADVIKDPDSGGRARQVVGNAGRQYCDWYANVQTGVEGLGGPGISTSELVCTPYFDDQGYDGPVFDRPFDGGQCPDLYTVQVFVGTDGIVVGGQSPKTLTGPLGGVTRTIGAGSGGPFPFFPVTYTFSENPTVNSLTVSLNQAQIDISSIRVTPVGDNPDDCGDPPGELVPGENPPPAPPAFPPGETPGVGPDGQPFFFIPDIDVPGSDPITLEPDPIGGPPPGGGAGGAGGDGLPGQGDAVGGEAGSVDGGDEGEDIDFGEPPEGRVWVGCIVELTASDAVGNIAGTGPIAPVYPRVLGNAALKFSTAYGTNHRLLSRFTTLTRPVSALIVVGVFLQAQPGASVSTFPISAPTCPENPCEET